MKLYTLTYDDARPTKQQVNIPTNSDYKIGIKVIGSKDAGKIVNVGGIADATILAETFNLYPQQVTLVGDDGSTISADPELTNGYVTFTLKAGDEANFTKYKVQVKNDTFDGIQYSEVKEGTVPRRTNVTASISCDNPTTIYPSDKLQLIEEDGKMHPSYGNVNGNIFYFMVKDTPQSSTPNYTLSYNMLPYRADNDSGENVVRKNTFADSYDHSISGYNIAPKFTGEMISEGYAAAIRYGKQVQGRYYIQFAVIPYENTFDLAVNIFKSQQGDIDDTNDFYTKDVMDEMLSSKADKPDVFVREQLSAMFTALKDTFTDAVKTIENITSADVVSCLYNIGAELFGTVQSEESEG